MFHRLGPEIDRIADFREDRAVDVKPSVELLSCRRRVLKLRSVLAEFDAPGIRADLAEAEARLQQLETPSTPRHRATALERLRVGSSGWWEESTPEQRNSELLAVVAQADVDLVAWKTLPPPPTVPGGMSADPAVIERMGAWQQACAVALVPVLELRP